MRRSVSQGSIESVDDSGDEGACVAHLGEVAGFLVDRAVADVHFAQTLRYDRTVRVHAPEATSSVRRHWHGSLLTS